MEIFEQLQAHQTMYQDILLKGFQMGTQDTLEKVKTISSLWASGKISNEDFAIKLNELIQCQKKYEEEK